jgi:hypothetical protein
MAIGFLFGCAAALLYKYIDLRHSVYEMGTYLLLAYIPYVFSEVRAWSSLSLSLFRCCTYQWSIIERSSALWMSTRERKKNNKAKACLLID